MIRKLIPGALALGLAATTHAQPATEKAPAKTEAATPAVEVSEATTPAVEVPAAPPKPKLDPAVIKTDSSYALGFRTGSNFANQFGKFGVNFDDLDMDHFTKGFVAAMKGGEREVDEAKLQAAMGALQELVMNREKEIGAANLADGKKFLEENGKRKEVTTTKSGLQYEVLAKGGEEKYVAPKEGDKEAVEKQFLVNFKGMLINGKQFDGTPEGEAVPVTMTLQLVEGFKEALTLMPVGAKWKLFMPSELAYREERVSADVGPNSTLIFELELVKIEDAPPSEGGMPFPMPQGVPGGDPHGDPHGAPEGAPEDE